MHAVLNRYPLWKYIMVLITLVIGIVYALPNLYGEDPAVQISRGAWRLGRYDCAGLHQTDPRI
ncbi:hypothetical protein [Salinivibrio costicola]|uniref:hypothetical protein n=1 Tax=Salinivibrio costicola TaxID=51367 RepID=UPI003F6FDB72